MKIRINEKEIYEIETDGEISGQEFLIFRDRINNIAKLMNDPFSIKQSDSFTSVQNVKSFRTRKKGIVTTIKNREEAIEIINLFYNDREKLNERYKEIGRDGLTEKSGSTFLMNKEIADIKRKYNIVSNEIGFYRYPLPMECKTKNNFDYLKI